MSEIKVPELGESIVEATVGNWLKQAGDTVTEGEAIVELETDKVNVEVISESAGVLQEILKQAGDTVAVGEVLAVVGTGAGAATAPAPTAAEPAADDAKEDTGLPKAAPAVRRFAQAQGVDLSSVKGSGENGRITQDDVKAAADAVKPQAPAAAAAAPAPAPSAAKPAASKAAVETSYGSGPVERQRMSRRRLTIAKRLVEAQHTAAMLTTFNEVDMTAIMDVRKRRKDMFKERHGVGLGFMSFFTKAVVGALKAFPLLNAEIDGDDMIVKKYFDIGIAVAAEGGLVVPVVRGADRLSFASIEKQIGELAQKARSNKLSIDELQGGSFTITNGGTFGSLLSTPILNAPQVGILGMHKIQERPVAVNGQVEIRPMMYIALSYDHRIVDGAEAVQFLVKVKELLEDPESLLLEG